MTKRVKQYIKEIVMKDNVTKEDENNDDSSNRSLKKALFANEIVLDDAIYMNLLISDLKKEVQKMPPYSMWTEMVNRFI